MCKKYSLYLMLALVLVSCFPVATKARSIPDFDMDYRGVDYTNKNVRVVYCINVPDNGKEYEGYNIIPAYCVNMEKFMMENYK